MKLRSWRLFPYLIAAGSVLMVIFYVARPVLGALGRHFAARQVPVARLAETQRKIGSLDEKIAGIERAALTHDPKLQAERGQVAELLGRSMAEHGHDPQAITERIKTIEGQLGDKTLPEANKGKLRAELARAAAEADAAQQAALRDPKVRPAYQALQKDLMLAMNKQDPTLPQLLRERAQAEQQLRALYRTAAG